MPIKDQILKESCRSHPDPQIARDCAAQCGLTIAFSCAVFSECRARKGQTETKNTGFLHIEILELGVSWKALLCCASQIACGRHLSSLTVKSIRKQLLYHLITLELYDYRIRVAH